MHAFIKGIARLMGYRDSHQYIKDDAEAMRSDWRAVGDDLWHAIKTYNDPPTPPKTRK